MTLSLSPAIAAPGASVTVAGKGSRKTSTRIRVNGTQVAEFTTGGSGQFNRTVVVPKPIPDSVVPVVEQQYSSSAWRQVDSGTLTVKNAVVVEPPPPPPSGGTPSAPIVITAPTTISDLSFHGPMPNGSKDRLGMGIYANGPQGSPIANIVIRRCTFSGFSWAINLSNVTNFLIEDCVIEDADYAGISVYSGVTGTIQRNTVRRIGFVRSDFSDPAFGNNAYGIILDRLGSGYNQAYPLSSGITVDANVVEDVPLWHGLDTHAGRQITWTNNIVRRCARAAFITGDSAGEFPHDNTFTGNRLEQAATKAGGTSKQGVTYIGLQTGNLTGNFISSTYGTPIGEYLAQSTNVVSSPNTTIP